jgi:HTH-type transcriptional regulator/antitoxin HigA
MEMKLIKSEKEYQDALNRLEKIIDAKPGSEEGDKLEILSLLIEKYEEEHYPVV